MTRHPWSLTLESVLRVVAPLDGQGSLTPTLSAAWTGIPCKWIVFVVESRLYAPQ